MSQVGVDRCDFIAVENDWIPITEIITHPQHTARPHNEHFPVVKIDVYDVAMMKLQHKIPDPIPHPSDVTLDTIRPICLPDSGFRIDYNQKVLNSRDLIVNNAKLTHSRRIFR